MSEDYKDLLYGLGSEDLDDFDFDLQEPRQKEQADESPGEDDFGEEDTFPNGGQYRKLAISQKLTLRCPLSHARTQSPCRIPNSGW